ncbi:MAG: hypothetical protein ABJO36_11410 [Litorimonas sp.]
MANTDPGAPEYEYDWQNPNKKSFDVGRVVSKTFSALRSNLFPFLLLTFFGAGVPMMLFSMWPVLLGVGEGINMYDPTWAEDIDWEGIIGPAIAIYVAWLLFAVFMYGALIQMSVTALNDRSVRLGDSVKTGLRLFFPLLAIFLIYIIGMTIGLMLLIVPGVFIAFGWALALHVKVIEGGTITGALSRSWSLSKGYKRWILLMMIIFSVLGAVIGLVFQLPVLFFGNSQTAMFEGGSMTFWVANAIGTGLAQMVAAALSYVGLTATYLEIRRVKEGVDVDRIADIFS